MTETAPSTRTPVNGAEIACAQCGNTFTAKRLPARFCSGACRMAYARDYGHQATVFSVRRLKRGISIVLHTDDEALLNLELGQAMLLVKPCS